jgi:epoxyqueuosine reductase QueG
MAVTREWIVDCIQTFSRTSANTLEIGTEPAWGEPIVGFARGDDPLFTQIKQQIGDFYWTPLDAFRIGFPEEDNANLTVISWVLPQTEATKQDNRKQTKFPAERWARSRKYGEEFNDALHDQLVQKLRKAGVLAISPSHLKKFNMHMSEQFGLSTSWSHRHAAYVAGLGTFGLCDGLITPVGKAMRCGSLLAGIDIQPTPRPYQNPHAYCLHYAKRPCQACVRRCPVGAITSEGHNKDICLKHVFETTTKHVQDNFGFEAYGCGLCQVGVPCESAIPRG